MHIVLLQICHVTISDRYGAVITAIPNNYASAAGSNQVVATFDELWAYDSERSRRRRSHDWAARRRGTGGGDRLAHRILGRGGGGRGADDGRGNADRITHNGKGPT